MSDVGEFIQAKQFFFNECNSECPCRHRPRKLSFINALNKTMLLSAVVGLHSIVQYINAVLTKAKKFKHRREKLVVCEGERLCGGYRPTVSAGVTLLTGATICMH